MQNRALEAARNPHALPALGCIFLILVLWNALGRVWFPNVLKGDANMRFLHTEPRFRISVKASRPN